MFKHKIINFNERGKIEFLNLFFSYIFVYFCLLNQFDTRIKYVCTVQGGGCIKPYIVLLNLGKILQVNKILLFVQMWF